MGVEKCEKCGTSGRTYWVADKEWLCLKCWKEIRDRSTKS